ncbi:MAG: hypothetical protein HRJ53_19700 [Acidobacteria bacterium Pan2503]|uniref:Uncharacterized protein n=1 Tax=Candidatus Acidiferrum panamense TaxID=2741543 RepID=A0A7V8NTF9_9BACT|nr:hypothetical protein [Candidatus Acidoferrum panamensis]
MRNRLTLFRGALAENTATGTRQRAKAFLPSAGYGVGFFGVDAELFYGFVDYGPFDLAVDQQLMQRG